MKFLPPIRRGSRLAAGLALSAAAVLALAACGGGKDEAPAKPAARNGAPSAGCLAIKSLPLRRSKVPRAIAPSMVATNVVTVIVSVAITTAVLCSPPSGRFGL